MDLLQPFLAFLEGLALIVSPCILPVLPLVLAASVDGGRRRPYGIITGFVVAFSLFVLGARALVKVFHINTDIIQYASLGLLFLFGLILLSEKLSSLFSRLTQGIADIGSRTGNNAGGGFISGLSIGALIGLVWTPCAGPIVAAVLVQVIAQKTDLQSVIVTLAFAIGAGVPMLIIALVGRKVMSRLSFFTTHAEAVRKAFGILILLAVVLLASGAWLHIMPSLPDTAPSAATPEKTPSGFRLEDALLKPYDAPDFKGIDGWLNSKPLTVHDLRGHVVLVDFWTYSCINCVRTLPYLISWYKKYHDKGFIIIGVHSPEFEFEKKTDNIQSALTKYGIEYPVAIDNSLETWASFHNQYWPAHYLIDQKGQVVYSHFGEGRYDVTENNIRYLLGLGHQENVRVASKAYSADQTPETYLGTKRADRFLSEPDLDEDEIVSYRANQNILEHHWALNGKWKAEAEKITAEEAGATLQLNFKGHKVFLVMGTSSHVPLRIKLALNGKPVEHNSGKDVVDDVITIKDHALYELLDLKTGDGGLLTITAEKPGVEMYAFTFGN